MKKIQFLLFFLAFLTISIASAQQGCLVGSPTTGTLWTSKNTLNPAFYVNTRDGYMTSPPSCPRVRLISKTGAKCKFSLFGSEYDEYNYELIPIPCPIDEGYFAIPIALFGFLYLKRFRLKIKVEDKIRE